MHKLTLGILPTNNLVPPGFRPNDQYVHVVVARFHEPIDHLNWLIKYPHTIYNRGEPAATSLRVVDCLENVGREAFIFFQHIVRHYDHLAEVNVFTQAVQNVKTLYTEEDLRDDVKRFAMAARNKTKDSQILSELNDGFVFLVPFCESSLNVLHMKNLKKEYGEEKCKIFSEGYEKLLNFTVANPRFSGTSCFAVTREAILRNSKDYYIRLARTLGSEINPIEGHFFERAWPQVFHSQCSSHQNFHCLLDSKLNC